METKEIEVQILGKTYNFNVPDTINSKEFYEIVDFVENRYNKIRSEAGDLDSFKLGLLVSINITEEFYSLKKENDKMISVLSHIDQMISPVDSGDRVSIRFST